MVTLGGDSPPQTCLSSSLNLSLDERSSIPVRRSILGVTGRGLDFLGRDKLFDRSTKTQYWEKSGVETLP